MSLHVKSAQHNILSHRRETSQVDLVVDTSHFASYIGSDEAANDLLIVTLYLYCRLFPRKP